MTILDVAAWLDLSWDTVKDVVKKRLEKDYRRIGYRHVRRIGIDEIYLGKRRKYITLVVDMDKGRIIWVGQGKGSAALREFWRRFKLSGGHLQAVAMDMSAAYASSVLEHAPHAIVTFDRFHVMKLMNERLDDLRREMLRGLSADEQRAAIKGIRWLLLAREHNLKEGSKAELERCLELNRPLQIAYILKEELALLWEQADGRKAWAFMRRWCSKARHSGISQLVSMAKTILKNARRILSYYRTRLTSAMVEGINRKIRGMLASAYGLRDADFLKLRLYALHESEWKFIG